MKIKIVDFFFISKIELKMFNKKAVKVKITVHKNFSAT
jgi:hypothetical protein